MFHFYDYYALRLQPSVYLPTTLQGLLYSTDHLLIQVGSFSHLRSPISPWCSLSQGCISSRSIGFGICKVLGQDIIIFSLDNNNEEACNLCVNCLPYGHFNERIFDEGVCATECRITKAIRSQRTFADSTLSSISQERICTIQADKTSETVAHQTWLIQSDEIRSSANNTTQAPVTSGEGHIKTGICRLPQQTLVLDDSQRNGNNPH